MKVYFFAVKSTFLIRPSQYGIIRHENGSHRDVSVKSFTFSVGVTDFYDNKHP